MCPCGGELTDWCFTCGDWACDDCGCPNAHHDHEELINWIAEAAS